MFAFIFKYSTTGETTNGTKARRITANSFSEAYDAALLWCLTNRVFFVSIDVTGRAQ